MKKLKWFLLASLIPLFFFLFLSLSSLWEQSEEVALVALLNHQMGQPTRTTGQMVIPIPITYSFIAMVLKQSNWTVFRYFRNLL